MKSDPTFLVVGPAPDAALAALLMRRLLPGRPLTLLVTPGDADPIGETTTPLLWQQLATIGGIGRDDLHKIANPTWSLGFSLRWGMRGQFHRAFEAPFSSLPTGLTTPLARLADAEGLGQSTTGMALLSAGKLFPKDRRNSIRILDGICGLQLAPAPFSQLLLRACQAAGAKILNDTVVEVQCSGDSLVSLRTQDGTERRADWILDLTPRADGLRSHLPEHHWTGDHAPGHCTRAWTALRRRGSEAIRSGATLETHESGWRWRVEHREHIGIGVAFHPDFLSEDAALQLLLAKSGTPSSEARLHTWETGHHARPWVGNLIAMGDAAGWTSPLTGTRLALIVQEAHQIARILAENESQVGEASRRLYQNSCHQTLQEIQDFSALHHRFHGQQSSAWWDHAAAATSLGAHDELVALYQQGGASPVLAHALPRGQSAMGIDTWLAALVGLGVPVTHPKTIPTGELASWRSHLAAQTQMAASAVQPKVYLEAVDRDLHRRPQPQKFY
ncbi:tryptophan halogenase [Haloferula luteola]|uniref:Tryptophan halogenase n=1 Tax=Haloferula luteola TaxID=595692 RepID=A0A840VAE2_9BACT|nr:tryptophan 7-halogenase [Haloferula luteola]MBB5352524.1 tryptophan halogenase [Haloferula luteola]